MSADLILRNGRFTTLDTSNPSAGAVAVANGVFTAVGREEDVMPLADTSTSVIDLKGRRALPGLIDNHLHIIRGGLTFNMELRWDGLRSLGDAMAMLKRQVPSPHRRNGCAWSAASPHISSRKSGCPPLRRSMRSRPIRLCSYCTFTTAHCLTPRRCALVGYTKDTPILLPASIVHDAHGNPTGLFVAKPNAGILYATVAKGPKLPFDYQLNSTSHFMRELNSLGVTGAIDAGRRLSELS